MSAIEMLRSSWGRTSVSRASKASASPRNRACCLPRRCAKGWVGSASTARWISDHGFRRVLVVTNNYHMPRSLLEMRRQYGNAVFHPYPVVTITRGRFGWIGDREASRVLFTEYLKYLGAWARGAVPGLGAHWPAIACVDEVGPQL